MVLVDGFTGAVGDDLDATDDGTLDSTPWTAILDSVAVDDGDSGDHFYGADTVLAEFFDGATFSPGGASRLPNGDDTNQVADWTRNDWDGTGFPGLPGNLAPNEAVNTPGTLNSKSVAPENPPLINEFVYDITGTDDVEYIEVFGDGGADYSNAWLLIVDGTGQVDDAYQLDSTDPTGLWTTGLLAETFPNGTVTTLLVDGWSGSLGQDLDTDNDGTFDLTPWTEIFDSVAVDHSDGGQTYSPAVLTDSSRAQEGLSTAPGGASRIPHGQDNDLASDWQRNDFEGGGLSGFPGVVPGQGEAYNTPGTVNRTNSVDYYSSVDLSSQSTLRSTLHATIDDHQRFPYSAGTTDTWDILEEADQDPTNSSNVLTIYKNSTEVKFGGGVGAYNREHTWPRTFGFPDQGTSSAYTDTHHLRLADVNYNSDRGSRIFGNCSAACTERVTDVNAGNGGGSGVYPGNSNWFTGGDGNSGTWEAWDYRKGDIARSMLYMDIRYEGGNHGLTGNAEPDLVLTDDTNLITSSGGNTTGTAYMGRLAVLLQWHAQDPPDAEERRRNEV
ncbi:MAG: endonuclease, partial [Acidobacteriota bacterium]